MSYGLGTQHLQKTLQSLKRLRRRDAQDPVGHEKPLRASSHPQMSQLGVDARREGSVKLAWRPRVSTRLFRRSIPRAIRIERQSGLDRR